MSAPFIQIFKTPRSQYVFDVNKNEIFPVSKSAFCYLQRCMANKEDIAQSKLPELQELFSEGYLQPKSVVEHILHPYTPYLDCFLERKVAKITLQLTQRCNLRCKYCIYSEDINHHQRSHSNKRMSWETAKRSVDFLLNHSADSNKVNIGFYGGEPLLEFPLIKQVISYAKKVFKGKELSFAITTNATLLNDEIIEYFADENVQLMISLDGPKEIHDQNRTFPDGRGSFDSVMEKVQRIEELVPDYAKLLHFSMVLDPSNDFDCINELKFSTTDFDCYSFQAAIVERDDGEKPVLYSEDYSWKEGYQQFLALLSVFERYPRDKVSIISKGLIDILMGDSKVIQASGALFQYDAPSGPCIPGQLRLFINTDGYFFPCERVSENSATMCIGSLNDGFDIKKAEQLLNVGSITENSCKNCWCFRHCTLCAKKADDGSEALSAKKKQVHCEMVKLNTYEKIRRLILLGEIDLYYSAQARKCGEALM